ncbi:MAG: iron ABC transporter permease [Candidatus Cohnella colombiensis]|uniref:Iron ABC transporter permease n=1 Tax=Candidatus Cohnella colombiensis TaxID=3121368 RepID=A0AA95JBI1_9BACL|nr:MAG: iron ABC transporter permease [Cohnella sp.]
MNAPSKLSTGEQARKRRSLIVLLTLSVLIIIVFFISLNAGSSRMSYEDVFQTLFGSGTEKQELILFQFRLPRIIISLLIGAGLAVSGVLLQGISRNPLADPGILGINGGAGMMVMLYIFSFQSIATSSTMVLPAIALIGSSLAAFIIYTLSYEKHTGIVPIRMLYTGIAISAAFSAAMIVIALKLSPEKYQQVASWLAGSIGNSNWKQVVALLPWIVIIIPLVYFKARTLDVLSLADHSAISLGASVNKHQLLLLAAAVGLAGPSVAVSGSIGFVGLIAPHLARRLVGSGHRILIPTSALAGSLLVIAADTIGRSIIQPSEIPTGVVVAVIGAPYFLYLLAKTRA